MELIEHGDDRAVFHTAEHDEGLAIQINFADTIVGIDLAEPGSDETLIMTDVDEDGIYSISLFVAPGTVCLLYTSPSPRD